MRRSRALPPRLARWVLLAATALGLAAMHSLGHGGGPVFGPAGTMLAHPAIAHPAAVLFSAADGIPADDCAGDGCAHDLGKSMPGGSHLAMGGVCQGLLEAGLILLVGLILLAARRLAIQALPGSGPAPRSTRGPPGSPAPPGYGLRLSSVSVLRI